ncbi:MAG TPA: hypothetical protein VL361_25925 [Candidatus Limnocylindrales bacterium]|nr:hypothetical protein [Candidatus Limnocylindrales bacterium]
MSSNLTAPTIFLIAGSPITDVHAVFLCSPFCVRALNLLMPKQQAAICPTPNIIYALPSIIQPLDLADLFPKLQPLEIELGSGDGSFLVAYARQVPEHNFIGVERLLGRIRKLERKGRRADLANLRAVRIESAYFLRYLLPPHSAAALHIYFPDPWPKRKHRRHRLVSMDFPLIAEAALHPGGAVYLRTDDEDYFTQIKEVFGGSALFRPVPTPAALAALPTDFETGFLARGIKTLHAAYQTALESQ